MLRMIQQQIARRPLRPEVWEQQLPPDYEDREFLLYVLQHGLAVLPPDSELQPAVVKNYSSAHEHKALVTQQLLGELQAHQLLRQPVDQRATHIHAIAAIPKSADEVRIIHDLSAPAGRSINDVIRYKQYKWASIDDALRLVTPGCYMARADVKNYYRHFPIDPADWSKQAFQWHFPGERQAATLWDPYLQFGLRNAPEVAHRFTLAVLEMMRRRGYNNIVGIMDDFLVVAATKEKCEETFQALLSLLRLLGFTVNMKPGKTVGPAQQQKFVGVVIDSVTMQVRLDAQRLAEVKQTLRSFLPRQSACKREVQSLAGLLNWVCKVVYGGRTFLRRILDTISNPQPPTHHLKLGSAFRADIRWWVSNLATFNGRATILPACATTAREFQTDAEGSGAVGVFMFGGYAGMTHARLRQLFPGQTPPPGLHISVYETFAVLTAVWLFPEAVRNQHLLLRSDNTSTVAAVNKMTCAAKGPSRAHMMAILRQLFSASVRLNCRITAQHIPGAENGLADALSRQDWQRFHTLLAAWRADRH